MSWQVTSVRDAHGGKKVNCLAIGPDGVVYTGGDDKVQPRWSEFQTISLFSLGATNFSIDFIFWFGLRNMRCKCENFCTCSHTCPCCFVCVSQIQRLRTRSC